MSLLSDVKISVPTKSEKIPSTDVKVKMRPFRVGDEKSLLMASQSEDPDQIISTLKKVIDNCIDGDYDLDTLTSFDVEYLFLKLRGFSVGEMSDIGLICKECEVQNTVKVDVTSIEIRKKDFDPVIKVTDSFGFEMSYNKIEDIVEAEKSNDPDSFIKLVARSVKNVFTEEQVIPIGEDELEDVIRIINELRNKDFENLSNYVLNQPRVVKDVKFKCKDCESINEVTLEGLSSFF